MAIKQYPLGIQTFERIRKEDKLYIDKTEYIYRMTHSDGTYFFLGRPRRFGKSLLVSTMQSYFEGKKDLFKGLAMEQLEKEWIEYPVIHLDMSGGKYMSEEQLQRYLIDLVEELTGVLNELDDFIHTNDYLWWDETKNKYVKFIESCYYVSEFPKPSEAKYPINVFTCYSTVDKQTHTWGLFDYTGNSEIVQNYRSFVDEYEMLTDFVNWFHKQKFDLFTGWNTDGFDLEYLVNRIRNLEISKKIAKQFTNKNGDVEYDFKLTKKFSPFNREPTIRKIVDKKGKPTGATAISIQGLYTNDYMEMYKKFIGSHWQSFALNYICDKEIGEGKLSYEGQIYETYKRDWNRYVEYNVNDVLLNKKLDDKRRVFDIVIPYCTECMITLDRCQSMIAAVEGYILKFMHKNNMRMNDFSHERKHDWWHEQGMFKVKDKDGNITYQNCDYERQLYDFEDFVVKAGWCYAYPGRYKWVISGDIQSSYPHQIMMYNISPEVKVINPTKEQIESGEVIQSEINGVGFRRTEHALLPDIIRQVFSERLAAKAELKKALLQVLLKYNL